MKRLTIRLSAFDGNEQVASRKAVMEFHICKEIREEHGLDKALFTLTGNVILADFRKVRDLASKLNAKKRYVKAGELNAMGLIDEILHFMVSLYRQQVEPNVFKNALHRFEGKFGKEKTDRLLYSFCERFPPQQVYSGKVTIEDYLSQSDGGESCRSLTLEEILLLSLANLNPAFNPFFFLFDDKDLADKTVYTEAIEELKQYFKELPPFGPDGMNLWDLLRSPALACPDSLLGQLEYMRTRWGLLLEKFLARILLGADVIKEETKPVFGGPGPSQAYTYTRHDHEYEKFSSDQDWMPRTVLLAKSTLVWLFQLSQKYGRTIERLDQIPDEELDELARRGFTGLWLIGVWERSNASKTVKQWMGNPEAAASAYSLYDYDIAHDLGGWEALATLRERCLHRGIRVGSDMVPNHTGIDSRWVIEHPDRFLQLRDPPFPTYTYNCGNLAGRDDVTVQIEDHYFNHSDAAVVFKRIDNRTGDTRYIYHGNDGTSMPWNDTAQIDFLNKEARDAVIATIVGVCKQFQIVRFDAAMTLAKRHIQRLWFPEPGRGGDIPSRAEHAISNDEFDRLIPNEFWREVVDRCAVEAPNTLLLAEAFWMMEGYFVRTLGMHRVYNSAFMNMLKNEDNGKYRMTIKNTLEFDPEVLKRFVNFLNNPDEETAVAQFGKGDKYFGICTLLVTMPGLPMFGHGQIEGFEEKYGMEYRRSYREEEPDRVFVDRHEREIFPLMRHRMLFSGSSDFFLYDFYTQDGSVNDNVFAYSNRLGNDRALVLYNNSYYQTSGWINGSAVRIPQKGGGYRQDSLAQALSLHHEDRFFTLLHEQRSDLWFIRYSNEIVQRGLFVVLNGYEAQVFLDIHEIEDVRGQWARLCANLNGQGVRDVYAALQDLLLEELYTVFADIFDYDRILAYFKAITKKSGNLDESIEAFREPILAFTAMAKRYIKGVEGVCDPFSVDEKFTDVSDDKIWKIFEIYLRRFSEYPDMLDHLKILHKTFETQNITAIAVGYGVFSLLRSVIGNGACGRDAVALIDHWSLRRKLQEALVGLNANSYKAHRAIEIMRAILYRTAPEEIKKSHSVEDIFLENCDEDDFKKIILVNHYEGTVWFNKEAFERLLFFVQFFLSLESQSAFEKASSRKAHEQGIDKEKWEARIKTIYEAVSKLSDAEKKSQYKLEALKDILLPKSAKKKASAPKKTGTKKAKKTDDAEKSEADKQD